MWGDEGVGEEGCGVMREWERVWGDEGVGEGRCGVMREWEREGVG